MSQVIDAEVTSQTVLLTERVVDHTGQLFEFQLGTTGPPLKLGRANELGKVMGSFGQHAQQVFRTDNGKKIGLWVTVDSGEEELSARFDQCGTGGDY